MGDMTLGQIAYEAYFKAAQGRSLVSGAALPAWTEQAEQIRQGWEAAAVAVLETSREPSAEQE